MSLSFDDLKTVKKADPPLMVLYGPEKRGKTTLAIDAPKPLFLQFEDGTPNGEEIKSFGLITEYSQVVDAIKLLMTEKHDFKTLVLDGLDMLEQGVIWPETASRNGWDSVAQPDFHKGYKAALDVWHELMTGLDRLRRSQEMGILMLGHSTTTRVDSPIHGPFTQVNLDLHKDSRPIILNAADLIMYTDYNAAINETDVGFGKKVRNAEGGSSRYLYLEGRPAYIAGNRYPGMPTKLLNKRGEVWPALMEFFPETYQY